MRTGIHHYACENHRPRTYRSITADCCVGVDQRNQLRPCPRQLLELGVAYRIVSDGHNDTIVITGMVQQSRSITCNTPGAVRLSTRPVVFKELDNFPATTLRRISNDLAMAPGADLTGAKSARSPVAVGPADLQPALPDHQAMPALRQAAAVVWEKTAGSATR